MPSNIVSTHQFIHYEKQLIETLKVQLHLLSACILILNQKSTQMLPSTIN